MGSWACIVLKSKGNARVERQKWVGEHPHGGRGGEMG